MKISHREFGAERKTIADHELLSDRARLQKIPFALTGAQAGPFPVSTEAMWCVEELGNYRVKNVPFFIDGLSFDDLIAISREGAEGAWRIQGVVEPSGNSTIWIYAGDSTEGEKLVDRLIAMGCGAEAGVIPDLYAINVPASHSISDVYAVIDVGVEERLIEVDYPSIRHVDGRRLE